MKCPIIGICKFYIIGGTDYNTDLGQRYHHSQQTVSLQVQEQNTDQREREAEELRVLERYNKISLGLSDKFFL